MQIEGSKPMEATAMERLNKIKGKIKWNTYRTIAGQIRSGNVEGAMVGIERLENKISQEGR